jgi:hypothetical protein
MNSCGTLCCGGGRCRGGLIDELCTNASAADLGDSGGELGGLGERDSGEGMDPCGERGSSDEGMIICCCCCAVSATMESESRSGCLNLLRYIGTIHAREQ